MIDTLAALALHQSREPRDPNYQPVYCHPLALGFAVIAAPFGLIATLLMIPTVALIEVARHLNQSLNRDQPTAD
jgi:hypothetical protein